MVPFGLDGLLKKVQVDCDGIGVDHRYRVFCPFQPVITKLYNSQVCRDEGMRGFLPHHPEALFKAGVFKCRTL
ncbi:MAG: hypothetical protein A4E40_00424 [Methanoregulaceae archaeon PtaU1.Bin059]|nr:MAG: hypothetical protein A4E40_00424 [Methanoregulaceae archaeon PtaU1.Bin059]